MIIRWPGGKQGYVDEGLHYNLDLAPTLEIKCHVAPLVIDDFLAAIAANRCSEVFACGTAAVVKPVTELHDTDGKVYELPVSDTPIANRLRETLLAIQTGKKEAPFGDWVLQV